MNAEQSRRESLQSLSVNREEVSKAAAKLCGNVRLKFLTADHRCTSSTFELGSCTVSRFKGGPITLVSGGVNRSQDPDCIKVGFVSDAARFRQNGITKMLAPGSCVIYDPARPYVFSHPTPTDQIVVHIPRSMLSARYWPALRTPQSFHRNESALPIILQSLLNITSEELDLLDEMSRARLSGTVVQLTSDLMEARLSTAPEDSNGLSVLLYRIKTYIAANISDVELSVSGIAERMGCSSRYVYSAFELGDVTPCEYIRNLRLDLARKRLMIGSGTESLSEIAFMNGFSCYAHFSRAFKSRFGIKPRECRSFALNDESGEVCGIAGQSS